MKRYENIRTRESTFSAACAMQWYRAGDTVQVIYPGICGTIEKTVDIPGVAQDQNKQDNENWAICRRIALEVEAYAGGNVYRCPDCREELFLPDDVGDKYLCPRCGTVHDVDDLEQLSIYDYMEDILDVDFTISRTKKYRSCSVCVGFGGPNIYIETDSSYVKLYWGNSRAEYPLSYSARDEIDDWAEEYFDCL